MARENYLSGVHIVRCRALFRQVDYVSGFFCDQRIEPGALNQVFKALRCSMYICKEKRKPNDYTLHQWVRVAVVSFCKFVPSLNLLFLGLMV